MTENEAIGYLRMATDEAGNEEFSDVYKDMCKLAIQALEEIQQYRAIGTVKGYERAIEASNENYCLYREYKAKVQQYEAIGTIEELQALKEKNEPKKPVLQATTEKTHYKCPCCNNIMQTIYRDGVAWGHIANYCEWCGQALET